MTEHVLRTPGATLPARPARKRPVFQRKRFFVLAVVVALGIAYLIVLGIQNASMYHLSVGELMARGDQAYTEEVRVGGKVVAGSVVQDPAARTMRFMISDDLGNSLPVVYRGVVPDAFKPDADVVLQGKLAPSGTFEATELLAKCPSKYVPEI
jgi:cytochrome c-type biogenesis protein CcmE